MDMMTDEIREEAPWTMMFADGIVICSESKAHVEDKLDIYFGKKRNLTRFNKIDIQGSSQMAVDKEAISLSSVYSYYSKCNLPLFYV